MNSFLIVCIFMFCLRAVAKLSFAINGGYPVMDMKTCLWGAFINFFLATWGLVLFFN